MKSIYSSLKKNIFHITNIHLSIISLPFLFYLYLDYSFDFIPLLGVFFVMIIVDYLFKNNYNTLVITVIIYILYSVIAYDDTLYVIQNMRFRNFSILLIITSFFIIYNVKKSKEGIKFFNTFLILFVITKVIAQLGILNSATSEPFSINNDKQTYLDEYKTNGYESPVTSIEKTSKPVILMILDGLSSSENLYEFSKDSLELKFDKDLSSVGFNLFPNFRSKSVWTKYSLPSLFNFNLHDSPEILELEADFTEDFKKARVNKKFTLLFKDNLLVDSLLNKSIKVHSYGHVTFSKTDNKLLNYYLWNKTSDQKNKNFFLNLSQITVYGFIKRKIQGEAIFEYSRRDMLNKLENLNPMDNNFYYFHFYAPHDPFNYFDEFRRDEKLSNTENYIQFRRFFLDKLFDLLQKQNLSNSRIIITGDHGFRYGDSKLDLYMTSLYLKGYDEIKSVNNIVVQDIGYLINESF